MGNRCAAECNWCSALIAIDRKLGASTALSKRTAMITVFLGAGFSGLGGVPLASQLFDEQPQVDTISRQALVSRVLRLIMILTITLSVSQAQVALFQRDQRSWLMQFAGTWQAIVGGDTNITWKATPIAEQRALQVHSITTVNGVTVRESWGFWAFDPDRDAISCTTVLSTGELLHAIGLFVKRSNFLLTLGDQLVHQEHPIATSMDLKPPDTFEAYQANSKPGDTRVFVFTRIARQP